MDRALNVVTGSMSDPANVLTDAERAEHQALSAKFRETINPQPTPEEARLDAMANSPLGATASVVTRALGGDQQAQDLALGLGAAGEGVGLALAGAKAGQATQFLGATTGRDVPIVTHNGFDAADQMFAFGTAVRSGLAAAGYPDAEPILQGSAVTGEKYTTGAAFDDGRTSDFDVAVVSPSLLKAAIDAGVQLRSGGTRTGPLDDEMLSALGLIDLTNSLSQQAGRTVGIMVNDSEASALATKPSIPLTKN